MTAAIQINTERRQQAVHLIEELRNERNEVWSMYCRIAEMKPFSGNQKTRKKLIEFSQILIDYISLGHFGIYERLISGKERRTAVLDMTQKIYPQLAKTTDVAVEFNDKYEKSEQMLDGEALQNDLSILGENLALRIDLEDKLCSMLLL